MSDLRLAPTTPTIGRSAIPAVREFSIIHRSGAWRDALRRRMLAGADLVAVIASLGLAAKAA
ncbi:MAG: hypothetical protein QOF37_1497, partial [Thermoleophilaceae bacterium]|nr:hypothetical protein [Thermoleophilaceae bacterium]